MSEYNITVAVNADGEAAVKSINRVQKEIKETGNESQRTAKKTKTAGKAIEDAFDKAGKSAERVGRKMSLSITAPLAAIAGTAAVMGTNFESSLAQMNTLVGVSREEIAGFRSEILELAPSLGNQPQQMADALFAITSAGQRGTLAIETLTAASKASAIGLGDTREIALAAGAAVTAYGKANLSSSAAVEILVGTVEQGNLAAADLAGVIGRVLSLAAETGVAFEDAGAFIASFTRQGVDAAQAVTGLRGVLATLVRDPTTKAVEAFAKMDTSAEEFKQQIADKGFIAAFQELVTNAEVSGISLGNLIPEVEGLTGALAVFASEGESAASISDKVGDAVGTLDARLQAAIELDPSIAFKQMAAELSTLQIEISTNVLPALLELAEVVKDVSESFRDLDPETQKAIVQAAAVVAAVGPLLIAFSLVARSTRILIPLLGAKGLAGGFSLLSNVIGRTAKLSTVFAAGLAGPVAAIGALTFGVSAFVGYRLQDRFKEMAKESETLADAIRQINLTGGISFTEKEALLRFDEFNRLIDLNRSKVESLQETMQSGDLNPRQFNEVSNEVKGLNEEYQYLTEQVDINADRLVNHIERMFEAMEPAEQKAEALKQFGDAFAYVSNIAGTFNEGAGEGISSFWDSLTGNPEVQTESNSDPFNDEYQKQLEDLQAQLEGPIAQAQLNYNRLVQEANDLFSEGEIALTQKNLALELYREQLDLVIKTQFEKHLEEVARSLGITINASKGYGKAMTQIARGFIQAATGIDMLSGAVENFDTDKLTDVDFEDIFENLRRGIDGAYDAQKQLNDEMNILTEAFDRGIIDESQLENLSFALQRQLGFARSLGDELQNAGEMGAQGFAALQSMTKQGSDAYYAMEAAIAASNVAAAIGAIMNQGMGDPYTAFARMASMAALVSQFVGSVGSIGGGASVSAEQRQEVQGTGTVLGDSEAKSESIKNAVEITADATNTLVGISRAQLYALQQLQDGISGAAGLVARGGTEFDLSSMKLGKSDWGFTSTKLVDQGIALMGGAITEMTEGAVGQAFAESRKSNLFSTSYKTKFEELDDAFNDQINLIFESMIDTVKTAGEALGIPLDQLEARIDAFEVQAQKISLKDLTAEEQQAELEAVFSRIFDDLANSVIPFIGQFQKIGEGMGETLVRVATSVQVTEEAILRLGLSLNELDPERMAQVSVGLVEAAGGIEDFIGGMENFISKFASDDFQFNIAESDITRALDQINLALPESRKGFFELARSIDISTEKGQEQLSTILSLTDAADDYYSRLEEIEDERLGLEQELMKLNGQTNELRQMELEKLDESNQKLQIRVWALEKEIALSEEMGNIQNEILQLISPAYAEYNKLAVSMANQINLLNELDASEQQLNRARYLHRLQVEEYTNGLRASIADLNEELFNSSQETSSSFNSMSNSVGSSMNSVRDSIINAIESVENWLDSSLLSNVSPLTPTERINEAERQFNEVVQRALTGDVDAIRNAQGMADQFINEAAGYYGTSTSQYQSVFDRVRDAMESIAGIDVGPAQQEPTFEQISNVEANTESTARTALEEARLAGRLVDQIAILSRLTGDSPSKIGEEFGIPIGELIGKLTGEVPQLTGDALAEYFNNIVYSIDDEMQTLLDIQAIEESMLDSLIRIEGLLGGDFSNLPEDDSVFGPKDDPTRIPKPINPPPTYSSFVGGSTSSFNDTETRELIKTTNSRLLDLERAIIGGTRVSESGFKLVAENEKQTRRSLERNKHTRKDLA